MTTASKMPNVFDEYSDFLTLMADGRERTAADVANALSIKEREATYHLNHLTTMGIIARSQISHVTIWKMKKINTSKGKNQ